jgi:transposase
MFVRIRKQPGKNGLIPYAYVVNNEWNTLRKKHEQKIIASLGRVSDLPEDGTIEKLVSALDRFCKKMGWATFSNGVILSNLTDETILSKTYDWGSIILTRHILKNLSLDKIISGSQSKALKKKISKEKYLSAITAILAHRLTPGNGASERSTYHWYTKKVYLPDKITLSNEDFYRSLDILIAGKEEIERKYYEQNLNLFNGKLDLVLFDTTSVYYFGAEGPAGEKDLLQYGFSKDGKGSLKQLIVGVLMTTDGVPIAHEVFPGNCADVNSFSRIVTILKEKYSIDKVILIADRGMVSEDNLVHLEQSGLSYIVGIRMRLLPQSLKRRLLIPLDEEEERYELEFMDKSSDNLYTREFPVSKFTDDEISDLFIEKIKKGKTATFDENTLREEIKKRRFFVCLNPFVKEKKKKDREFFTRIIERKIATTPIKDFIIKNGYKKYLKFDKGLSPSIDYERLRDEEIYDGKWIIMTNEKEISSYMAGTYYKSLQIIERGFRDLKSLITVQPVYHYKEERIRAHVFACFLLLVIKWYICRILNQYSQEDGYRFIEEMVSLKAVAVEENIHLYVRTAISHEAREIMGKLGMKIPGKVISDGRIKLAPVSHSPGRPRKDRSRGQINLI